MRCICPHSPDGSRERISPQCPLHGFGAPAEPAGGATKRPGQRSIEVGRKLEAIGKRGLVSTIVFALILAWLVISVIVLLAVLGG